MSETAKAIGYDKLDELCIFDLSIIKNEVEREIRFYGATKTLLMLKARVQCCMCAGYVYNYGGLPD